VVIERDVHRKPDGSIDMDFYKNRAQRLRSEFMIELALSIREHAVAWVRRLRNSLSGTNLPAPTAITGGTFMRRSAVPPTAARRGHLP
jgi:hypothetical protein